LEEERVSGPDGVAIGIGGKRPLQKTGFVAIRSGGAAQEAKRKSRPWRVGQSLYLTGATKCRKKNEGITPRKEAQRGIRHTPKKKVTEFWGEGTEM